jgi:fructuronate reductase
VSQPRPRLGRSFSLARAASPIRLVHLGLGAFFRAHQAWYTDRASDGLEWGYSAFGGRSAGLAEALEQQGGCYSVIIRAHDQDRFEIVSSISKAHPANDDLAWRGLLASPSVSAVTVTVTEAGWCRRQDGSLDIDDDLVAYDISSLKGDLASPVRSAPARLVAGLAARVRAGAGPIALVSCDNLPANGEVASRMVLELAGFVDEGLSASLETILCPVTTVVDRITPRALESDRRAVAKAMGVEDCCPVVTEPYHEWVLAGSFPAGRPRWETAGATFVEDARPYELRKLLLLNGAHSLLAYGGSLLGYRSIPEVVADATCQGWLDAYWADAAAVVVAAGMEENAVFAYERALLERFGNARLADQLQRIAEDGSKKLAVRIAPVLGPARRRGQLPLGALRVVAAWVCHLGGIGGLRVADVAAGHLVPLAKRAIGGPMATGACAQLLELVDAELAGDVELVAALANEVRALARTARR